MTLRVYWTEPKRAALLARVVAATPDGFVPDRTILHGADRAYGHDVPSDRGEILGGGHKAKVVRVRVGREGDLVHHVRGPVPPVGTELQVHLDEGRRAATVRAHAAAHLLAAAVVARRGELLGFPATTGGGQVRARFRLRGGAAEAGGLLDDVNRMLRAGGAPLAEHVPRDVADRRVLAGTDLPPHDVVRLVGVGGAWTACDAPVVRDLRDLGGARWSRPPAESKGALAAILRVGGR